MAARNLVQALEGVHFPCDRAQLLDYARRNNLGDTTLAALEEIPEGRYRDLGEIFTALPELPHRAERKARRRPEQAEEEGRGAERQEAESQGAEGQEAEGQGAGEELPPLPAPMEWWLNGWQQIMMPWEVTAHCLRGSVEAWPQWLRLTRHLWFPWSK